MEQDKKKKLIIAISSASAAIIVIAGGIWFYIANRPIEIPDPQQDPAAAHKLLSSEDFNKLTPEQQVHFVRKMRPTHRPTPQEMTQMRKIMQEMSPEQRRTMMENMRKVHMREMDRQFDEFFKLPKVEQLKELDRRIAEQDKRRNEMQKRRAERDRQRAAKQQNSSASVSNNAPDAPNPANAESNNTNNRPRRPNSQMRREFESNIPASTRAKMQQYRQMERLRRQGKLK